MFIKEDLKIIHEHVCICVPMYIYLSKHMYGSKSIILPL
jgi:hypothetical protein